MALLLYYLIGKHGINPFFCSDCMVAYIYFVTLLLMALFFINNIYNHLNFGNLYLSISTDQHISITWKSYLHSILTYKIWLVHSTMFSVK